MIRVFPKKVVKSSKTDLNCNWSARGQSRKGYASKCNKEIGGSLSSKNMLKYDRTNGGKKWRDGEGLAQTEFDHTCKGTPGWQALVADWYNKAPNGIFRASGAEAPEFTAGIFGVFFISGNCGLNKITRCNCVQGTISLNRVPKCLMLAL